MAEEVVQEEAPVVEESGLPSDVEQRSAEQDKPSIELPNGWESVEAMAEHIKKIEDKYAQLNDKIAREQKGTISEIEAEKAEIEKSQMQTDTINKLVPEFVKNNMTLTDDMIKELEATGLNREQIELGAYRYKENRAKNASYVGGEENFVQIMEYVNENMSEAEHASLAAVVDEFAKKGLSTEPLMLGLQAMYEKGVKPESNADRLRGTPTAGGIKPYETKQELFRDRAYIQGVGKNDAGAVAKYKQRLAATPDEVWMS